LEGRFGGRGKKLIQISINSYAKICRYLKTTDKDFVNILINITDFQLMPGNEQTHLINVFKSLTTQTILGITLYSPSVQLDFLIDLIHQYNLSKTIRIGIAHPCLNYPNQYLKPKHYPIIGQRIIRFLHKVNKNDISLQFDCGFVPCMFPVENLKDIQKFSVDIGKRCSPIIDIMPDNSLIPCFPLSTKWREYLTNTIDQQTIIQVFEKQMSFYRQSGIYKECQSCTLKQNGDCFGGCLASTIKRFQKAEFSFSIESDVILKNGSDDLNNNLKENNNCNLNIDEKSSKNRNWIIPYVDHPISFWNEIKDKYFNNIQEVYFPISSDIVHTERPVQQLLNLKAFLKEVKLPCSLLINPITLPFPAKEIAPKIIEEIKRLIDKYRIIGATISNLLIAECIHKEFPGLDLTASVLMDISHTNQIVMIKDIFKSVVPSSRIMRNAKALLSIKQSFQGKVRLIVNESCIPACPFRIQHFYEMPGSKKYPESLCRDLLKEFPWLTLSGSWVLPQHLHYYDNFRPLYRITFKINCI